MPLAVFMTENSDSLPTEKSFDDFVIDPSGDRLPVLKEDYDIETELFSEGIGLGISKRTDKEVPEYLLKSYYDTRDRLGNTRVFYLAQCKAERFCKRQFPRDIIRDMGRLYIEAEGAFRIWWAHLEDSKFVEVADEPAKRVYIEQFFHIYHYYLELLDNEHPEHLKAYREEWASEVEYVQTHGRGTAAPARYEPKDYLCTSPRWKQNIAADGRNGGARAIEEDFEIGVGFPAGLQLEELAQERFRELWKELTLGIPFDRQYPLLKYPSLRTIYVHNFMRTYTEQAAGGQGPAQPQGTGARIVISHLDQDTRVYLIEINDPQHLAAPVQVEIAVRTEDDVQLRSETDNAG